MADVAEFIRAMALAWKNLAAYPPGHPALRGSVEAAHDRLLQLRGPAPEVAFGIAADGILFGNDKIDSSHSQKFAQALYTRGVAVLRFSGDTTPKDVEIFLRLLGGTSPDDQTRPMWEQLTASGVVAIHLTPVDYSSVRITSELDEKPKKEASSLWDDILRALLAGRELTPQMRERLFQHISSVDELTAMIVRYVEHPGEILESEFDPDATFGVRLTVRKPETEESPQTMAARVADAIGRHVAASTGLRRQLAVQQIVQLLRGLPDPLRGSVIRAVLRTLATDEGSGALLRELTHDLPPREILDALRYVSTMSKLSTHAMLLLQALVEATKPKVTESAAPPSVLNELLQLFGEEDIDRFNPPEHSELLSQAAIYMPEVKAPSAEARKLLGDRLATVADDNADRLLARTLIDLLAKYGEVRDPEPLLRRIETLFRAYVASGEFADAVALIDQMHELALTTTSTGLRTAIEEGLGAVANPETINALITSLIAAPPEKTADLQQLIHRMGTAATRSLLISLAEENNRSRRRKLFDFVVGLGGVVVPEVRGFLTDSRWYVVRNMILLLRAANDRTSLADIRRLSQHPDLRVRLEAIKSLFALDPSVPQTLLENAINDRDPKLAESAIALVGSYGIREGVEPLLNILGRSDRLGMRRALRLRAIKSLGELGDPAALPRLEKFFTDSILPWPSRAERRAAWESLAGYPAAARAEIVERGLQSRDRFIRQTCEKLEATA